MDTRSIRVRTITTLFTNVLRAGLFFVAGLLIARNLGASEFGNLNFLLGSFTSLTALVNMESTSAFFTLLSRKPRGKKFFQFFAGCVALQLLILVSLTLFAPDSLKENLWLGQPTQLLLLALFASFTMTLIWKLAGNIGESVRDTVGVQVRNLALSFTYILCIFILGKMEIFSIKRLLLINIVLHLSFSIFYLGRLIKIGVVTDQPQETFRNIASEFKSYCIPLISATWLGFFYSFADYWLLQKFGGSVQQGYYAIGRRFAGVSQIATFSILKIFWKEIAEAHENGNMEVVRNLFQRVSKSLVFISAVISCVLIPFSEEILLIVLGPSYLEAAMPLAIMFLFPIYQSMAEISGVMLLAMKKTKIKNTIDVFFLFTSIITAYIVLAPQNLFIPGLELGAAGLSQKTVLMITINANLLAYFVSRNIGIAFEWRHPIYSLALLLPFGFLCKFVAEGALSGVFSGKTQIIVTGGGAGILYLAGAASLVYVYPSIAGFTKEQINSGFSKARATLGDVIYS